MHGLARRTFRAEIFCPPLGLFSCEHQLLCAAQQNQGFLKKNPKAASLR